MSMKKSKFRHLFTRNLLSLSHANDKPNKKENISTPSLPSLELNQPDFIIAFSPEGDVISQTSKRLIELLGSRLQTKDDFFHLFSDSTSKRLENIFHTTLDGKSEHIEIEFHNGEPIQLALTFIPILIKSQNVEGIYVIINNVTEYSQLKHSLEMIRKHLNHSQQIAAVGSWEYIIHDDKTNCSETLFDIIGIDKSKNIPLEPLFGLVHQEDQRLVRQKLDKSIKEGKSFFAEFRILHGKTKKIRYITAKAECMMKNDIPYKLIGVIKDDTPYKQLEKDLNNRMSNL